VTAPASKPEVVPPVEAPVEASQVIDPSSIKPEEYVCFGTNDPASEECQQCQFNKQCAEKAAGK
jgi:hypothetical protein